MKWPWKKRQRFGSGGQPIPDVGEEWTPKQKTEEVQHWARSMGLVPVTLECGHVFCALSVEPNGDIMMPGASGPFKLNHECPLHDCHDEEGRAINP